MKIDNKISRFLTGPYIFFGLIFVPLFLIGIIEKQWLLAGFGALILAYLFGSFSGVIVDIDTRKFKSYNQHFGLFKTGQWRSFDDYIGLTLVPIKRVYTMHSRSNRTNSSEKKEYHVYLVNKSKKPSVLIKACETPAEGQNSLDEFAIWLHLPVYSVKR